MRRFAADTEVPVQRSRAEVEDLLMRYGATEFQTGWKQGAAMIAFRIKGLYVRVVLPMPSPDDKEFSTRKSRGYVVKASDAQVAKAYDQELRRRWRALHLVVKAKLEAVESKISTTEQEWLAYVVMPNDRTMMEWLAEEALPYVREGRMPPLALPAPQAPRIVDVTVMEDGKEAG